ncbi:hypothetical protein VaNZ11_006057 [Volvox africanus]|uniref:Glycosyl transferase CAP10 domain-containing protein n=1 Tax=Volvox africanus TaxID=51714 RepID=A0ABQ5S111_9CHLO|nr:hypothetical protein VaNZ11_006057 [Volvox africanus]
MAEPPPLLQQGSRARRRALRLRPADVIWGICLGLCGLILLLYGWHLRSRNAFLAGSSSPLEVQEGVITDEHGATTAPQRQPQYSTAPLLVSYAFYEKDVIQRSNLEFFLQHGWVGPPAVVGFAKGGTGPPPPSPSPITWVFVVTGSLCSPCVGAFPIKTPIAADPLIGVTRAARIDGDPEDAAQGGGSSRSSGGGRSGASTANDVLAGPYGGPPAGPTLLLWREENVGMDLAAHNTSLEYLTRHAGGIRRYRYFLLINSSVKGPYYPAYLPTWWHWTHGFLERFQPLPEGDPRWTHHPTMQILPPGTPYGPMRRRQRPMGPAVVRAVGCSLVCLPEVDAGGPGPRLESWAVALDDVGMELVIRKGVFKVRTCKTCADKDDGIIVGGEYGITSVLLEGGHNVATLMSKYARDVDWRDERHWGCNDMVHPSRHGTYDGIAFHPYETIFVKSSWHVADPYTRRYSLWMTQHREGDAGTDGEWNEKMYRYAISTEAQMANLLEAAYNVEKVQETLAKHREQEQRILEEEQRQAGDRAASLNV